MMRTSLEASTAEIKKNQVPTGFPERYAPPPPPSTTFAYDT